MKTAILQQFSSKKSRNLYYDQILKKLKLQCQCKIVQNVPLSLQITRFMKTTILQQFSSKNSKNIYPDQISKKRKITVPVQNCEKPSS